MPGRNDEGWGNGPGRAARAVAAVAACYAIIGLGERPASALQAPAAVVEAAAGLGADDPEVVQDAVARLGALGDAAALPLLEAMADDELRIGAGGRLLTRRPGRPLEDALTGVAVPPPASPPKAPLVDNALRRVLLPVLAGLRLRSPDAAVRRAAAEELAKRAAPETTATLRAALAREVDAATRETLAVAVARADLRSADPKRRLEAVAVLRGAGNASVKSELALLLERRGDGTFAEPDAHVRQEAARALSSIELRESAIRLVAHLLYGLSLASVLLFAALGLAVTFGVMGVINMAHGEMLMLGAYATYSVQVLLQTRMPDLLRYYVLVAIPVAFLACLAVGVLLERLVVRRLYGRPLETLLATWGISLGLIQSVRLVFGAQNVSVANPDWLAGGYTLFHGLVLPWNRIGVVLFVVVVAACVWGLMQRTRWGLAVRAVTQNRSMAACLGVSTARVDLWTFGVGSGIAGLGGVALSQLGNVGPELGQSYVIDSFMVVVLGGVGRIAGTVAAALGLGVAHKLIEPLWGAVLGKIAILAVIIVFIQRRPQGMFAPKGRVET